jgi:hypothetical protein
MHFSKELFLQYYAKHNMFLEELFIISKTKQHTYFKSFLECTKGVHDHERTKYLERPNRARSARVESLGGSIWNPECESA